MRQTFFFSSRRRHTRWTGDWSSDVCSSDLLSPEPPLMSPTRVEQLRLALQRELNPLSLEIMDDSASHAGHRSEERRVGKECRARLESDNKKRIDDAS